VVEPRPQPGLGEVLLLVAAVVAAVIGAAVVTGLLPAPLQEAISQGPVLIGVLIVGTAWLLWRISRGRPIDDGR
jgi:hypothetical protein